MSNTPGGNGLDSATARLLGLAPPGSDRSGLHSGVVNAGIIHSRATSAKTNSTNGLSPESEDRLMPSVAGNKRRCDWAKTVVYLLSGPYAVICYL